MIGIKTTGSFQGLDSFLKRASSGEQFAALERYGAIGVDALARATPQDSGRTANSWQFKVSRSRGLYSIEWFNTNVINGVNVAIILQYGHGTGTGGYVSGYDYINPAIRPVFDMIADNVWKEVTRA